MDVTDSQQRQILQSGPGLAEAEKSASSGVNHDHGSAITPYEVPR
jgi:hypothetical protein